MLKKILLTSWIFIFLLSASWSKETKNKNHQVSSPGFIENTEKFSKTPGVASPQAFKIPWTSINAGGGTSLSSANFKAKVTTAQSVIGESQSANYKMKVGFWYGPGLFCTAIAGDANADSKVNLVDIIFKVNYVFKGGPEPSPLCRGDDNANGRADLVDIIYAVNFIFKGGPAPKKIAVCCL